MDGDRPVAVEVFTSAPGPMGWRYYATIQRIDEGAVDQIDLSVDARGRVVRSRVARGGHEIMIATRGDSIAAILDGEQVAIDAPPGTPIAFPSPGAYAVTLDAAEAGSTVPVIDLDPTTLAPTARERILELIGESPVETPAGTFDAARWLIDGREVTIGAAVVFSVERLAVLQAYERGATGPAAR